MIEELCCFFRRTVRVSISFYRQLFLFRKSNIRVGVFGFWFLQEFRLALRSISFIISSYLILQTWSAKVSTISRHRLTMVALSQHICSLHTGLSYKLLVMNWKLHSRVVHVQSPIMTLNRHFAFQILASLSSKIEQKIANYNILLKNENCLRRTSSRNSP